MEPEALTRFALAAWTGAAHVEGLVIGNVTAEEALAMGASIRESFASSAPVAADAFPAREIAIVPAGDTRFALETPNPEEGTNVVYVYYQNDVGTHASRAVSLLGHQLIGEKLFGQPRTQERLGYDASGARGRRYAVGVVRMTGEWAVH